MLEGYPIGDPDREDEMKWRRDEEGGFTVRQMYEELSPQKPELYPSMCAWHPQIQLKVSIFVWKLWWNKAQTIDNLIRRGMIIPNWCCLCISAGESADHIFLYCLWVYSLWSYFLAKFGVEWVMPGTIRGFLSCWPAQSSFEWSSMSKRL